MILIFKLIEIWQYVLIGFIVGFLASKFLDRYLYDRLNKNFNKLFVVMIYLFLLSSIYYLLIKYMKDIPFILHPISKQFKYIPSFHNENIRGITLGIGFIYFTQQPRFTELINELYNEFINVI